MAKTPTSTPVKKVLSSGITGALVTLIVIILNNYVIVDKDKKIPAELSSAATTVLTFIVGYLVPPDPKENAIEDENKN